MARLLEQRASEMRAEVERLRSEMDASAGGGRPPPAPALEARFAALEVERELEQLRAARAGEAPPRGESSTATESRTDRTDIEEIA
jgi:hypothetical protein